MGKRVSNRELAKLLRSVSSVYLLTGESRFKVIAYEKAASTIEKLTQQLYDMWENNKLVNVAGIGPSITSHINEYFSSPLNNHLVRLKKKLPDAVYILMDIPGIGARNAYRLTQELNINNAKGAVKKLRNAVVDGRVASLEGFGERSANSILKNIDLYTMRSKNPQRMLLSQALFQAEEIIKYLLKNNKIKKAVPLGSLRRMLSTIGDIDIAVLCMKNYRKDVIDYFTKYPKSTRVVAKGPKKAGIITDSGLRVDMRTVSDDIYGSMLQYFTGSKDHNIKLRDYALKMGLSLSEYGIKTIGKGVRKKVKFKNEKDLYNFLDLQYIPPEIRQGEDEISLAKKRKIPVLVEKGDIRGDFHMHSSYNIESSHDIGDASYRQLLEKAGNLDYEYVVFTDHNPSTGNHTKEQIIKILKERFGLLKSLQKKNTKCRFFISLEIDIKPDGELAIPTQALQYVDFAVVGIHSSFRMDRDKMTKRILKALSYPKVKILAHPTTRLLNKREEVEADWELIFKFVNKKNIALEINADPSRLDLPDRLVKQARRVGTLFVIGTDAHSLQGLDNMNYGVSVARRGGLTKNDIMNTKSHKEISSRLLT